MLRSLKDLAKYSFEAKDGDAGRVRDFYFDDLTWTVRYLVADTGRWLPGRLVLIPPPAIGEMDWRKHVVHLKLSKKAIEDSPHADENRPVSRQHERELFRHYGWHPYWIAAPASLGAPAAIPASRVPKEMEESALATATEDDDPHLRSLEEVSGYDIQAQDGSMGVVTDLVCDDANWIVRYFVVDTHKWLPGRKVLVAPQWIDRIDWSKADVMVDMTREELKESPAFDPNQPINRQYEERLYDFFGRPKYWKSES